MVIWINPPKLVMDHLCVQALSEEGIGLAERARCRSLAETIGG
jgi:hypothetical protein